jgi:hypothetical protein
MKRKNRKPYHTRKNIKNQRFGRFVAKKYIEKGRFAYKWLCECDCGNISYLRFSELKHQVSPCKCQWRPCKNGDEKEGFIRNEFWNSVVRSAKKRGISLEISKEDASRLFVEQKGLCALTGEELRLAENLTDIKRRTQTASLDRIDSKLGYTIDNVQWTHRDINIMKSDMDQDEFIYWCKRCAKYNKNNNNFQKKESLKFENLLNHMREVEKYCEIIMMYLLGNESDLARLLILNGRTHDFSKMEGFEWRHIHDPNDPLFKRAVEKHVKNNKHHPECWRSIHHMPKLFIAEMCADWMARSVEFGTDLHKWIKDEAMPRFDFNTDDFVYDNIMSFVDILEKEDKDFCFYNLEDIKLTELERSSGLFDPINNH